MEREKIVIDATNQSLGRLASKIAILLQGKDKPDFDPSKDEGKIVIVKNLEKMKITGNKIEEKKYYFHSGYLGGLKEIKLKEMMKKDLKKVLSLTVFGMLPKNKLRKKRIQRLKFE